MKSRALWLAIALIVGATARVPGASVIPPTFGQLVDRASEIFVGRVVSSESRWVQMPERSVIFTFTTFAIDESLKGDARGQTTLRFRGGTVGDTSLKVADMPAFGVGDRVVLFVGDRAAVSPLVGFMHGRFRINREVTTGVDRVATYDGLPLAATASLGPSRLRLPASATGLPLGGLRSEILNRLRSRQGAH